MKEKKNSFAVFLKRIISLRAKNFQQHRKNCTSPVQKNIVVLQRNLVVLIRFASKSSSSLLKWQSPGEKENLDTEQLILFP